MMTDLLELNTANAVFHQEEFSLSGYLELVAFCGIKPHQPNIQPFNHVF